MNTAPTAQATDLFVTPKDLAFRLRVSIREIWRMIERGHLPQPIRFGRKIIRWRDADVLAHLERLQAGQTEPVAS